MRKADYKRLKSKEKIIQWRYRDRDFLCTSHKWIKWAKKYLNRSRRRKEKNSLKREKSYYSRLNIIIHLNRLHTRPVSGKAK